MVPKTVVNSDSVTAFKSRLKTFLFSWAFSLPSSQFASKRGNFFAKIFKIC